MQLKIDIKKANEENFVSSEYKKFYLIFLLEAAIGALFYFIGVHLRTFEMKRYISSQLIKLIREWGPGSSPKDKNLTGNATRA